MVLCGWQDQKSTALKGIADFVEKGLCWVRTGRSKECDQRLKTNSLRRDYGGSPSSQDHTCEFGAEKMTTRQIVIIFCEGLLRCYSEYIPNLTTRHIVRSPLWGSIKSFHHLTPATRHIKIHVELLSSLILLHHLTIFHKNETYHHKPDMSRNTYGGCTQTEWRRFIDWMLPHIPDLSTISLT